MCASMVLITSVCLDFLFAWYNIKTVPYVSEYVEAEN